MIAQTSFAGLLVESDYGCLVDRSSDRPKYEFNDLDTEESSQGIIFVRAFEWRYVPSAGSSKCKNSVVGKGCYHERRGANDELQGLSLRDNDCKPRFSEIGGAMSIGGSINVEPCHTTRSLRHGIPFHTYII